MEENHPQQRLVYSEDKGIKVPFTAISLHPSPNGKEHPDLLIYRSRGTDCDPQEGLEPLRSVWITQRAQAKPATSSTDTQVPDAQTPGPTRSLTQMHYARAGVVTAEMRYVALRENCRVETVMNEVAAGRAVIPANINHPELEPMIVGRAFLTKVCANIGYAATAAATNATPASPTSATALPATIAQLRWATRWGADVLLAPEVASPSPASTTAPASTTSPANTTEREQLLRNSPVPVGTVPLYQALAKVGADPAALSWDIFRETVIEQAEQGVDLMTIHAGVRQEFLPLIANRRSGIASRAGAIIAAWCQQHNQESFLFEHFDELCTLLARYDVTLALGAGLRPGCLADANDQAQLNELHTLAALTQRAWDQEVQVILAGPGHTPLNLVEENVRLEQGWAHGAPFSADGPLVTDIAPGHETISATIGAALGALNGCALLNFTPEGPGCNNAEAAKQVIIANKIAAHAADVAKCHVGSRLRDDALSQAQAEGRWEDVIALSLDPDAARAALPTMQATQVARNTAFTALPHARPTAPAPASAREQLEDQLQAGIEAKSAEFRRFKGDIYVDPSMAAQPSINSAEAPAATDTPDTAAPDQAN